MVVPNVDKGSLRDQRMNESPYMGQSFNKYGRNLPVWRHDVTTVRKRHIYANF